MTATLFFKSIVCEPPVWLWIHILGSDSKLVFTAKARILLRMRYDNMRTVADGGTGGS
jgi:hypothetical protein